MYRQVLGNKYAMASERLKGPESLFNRGVELQHFVEGDEAHVVAALLHALVADRERRPPPCQYYSDELSWPAPHRLPLTQPIAVQAMKVSTGTRGTSFSSGRQVTFAVTGMNNNNYSRTADMVLNVPYTRMNETMRMVQRMGGKITGIAVNGGDSGSAPAPARKKTGSTAAKG